jgi:hypothetical protein
VYHRALDLFTSMLTVHYSGTRNPIGSTAILIRLGIAVKFTRDIVPLSQNKKWPKPNISQKQSPYLGLIERLRKSADPV